MSPKCEDCGEPLDPDEIKEDYLVCEGCNRERLRGEAVDRMLDDPRHGQAASLNRRYE